MKCRLSRLPRAYREYKIPESGLYPNRGYPCYQLLEDFIEDSVGLSKHLRAKILGVTGRVIATHTQMVLVTVKIHFLEK